jgi:hypothetical protein
MYRYTNFRHFTIYHGNKQENAKFSNFSVRNRHLAFLPNLDRMFIQGADINKINRKEF